MKATYITSSPLTGECPECGKVVKVKLGRTGEKNSCYVLRRHGSCPGGEQEPVKGSVKRRMTGKKKGASVRIFSGGAFESRPEKALRNLIYRTS